MAGAATGPSKHGPGTPLTGDLAVAEFDRLLLALAHQHWPGARSSLLEASAFRLKRRSELGADSFLDVFYSRRTQRIDLAVVQRGVRVFGLDNLGGWHRHPHGQAAHHEPVETPTWEAAFAELAEVAARLPQG